MVRRLAIKTAIGMLLLALALPAARAGEPSTNSSDAPGPGVVDFNREVRPILSANCFFCHGPDANHRQADLRLDVREGAVDAGVIVPGDAESSYLIQRILAEDAGERMPPPDSNRSLTDQQKDTLRRWIDQGAEYRRHWAFEPPVQIEPPSVEGVEHPIDRFLQARLHAEGLRTSPLASAATQIRRASLDLVGLPPTLDELDRYEPLLDGRPAEHEYVEMIDRMLDNPHHGERWARWWLDQARYADSNGYSIDAPRQIWAYRDWVVDALNADMPFDQFTLQQLAGDMLPGATDEQRIATGFHRNTPINEEGGIDPEQFRIDSVFDRVATTGTVWLGLTIGCAQCHDHKFDPISQREYYQLFAFWNNQDEPAMPLPESMRLGAEGGRRGGSRPGPTTLVLREREEPRKTTIFIKGDFTRPADEVSPATPAILHPLQPASERPNRIDFARWLTRRDNPLTARVIVNRVWQQYFGRGLVETENDFGSQGTPPSHPELLDWLAVDFMEHGWRLKHLHRLIVTSHAYRQSSKVDAVLAQIDPNNYLLARQTRLRLDAELIRDAALSASGLLCGKMGGPPVFPPIPDGVMGQGQIKHAWRESRGEDRYRRGLYTFVFRASPPPTLSVFDAPEGISTCTRRIRSNTPLQALTMLNDATSVEFAQGLEQIIRDEGLKTAFRRCTSRWPDAEELAVLEPLDSFAAARVLLNLDETITRE